MKRLLQLVTYMLMLAALLTPVVEFFDQWDPPGPDSDTEMAVFGFVLVICLVLLLCKLTAAFALLIQLILVTRVRQDRGSPTHAGRLFTALVPPQISPPLRI